MNVEPNERRDADALDAFWDEVVFGQVTGRPPRGAESPDEELVMNLQVLTPGQNAGAEQRLRQLVFGSAPEPLPASGPMRPFPLPRPEPARSGWSVRNLTSLAAAALLVVVIGALVAAQNGGWLGSGGEENNPTAIPAAVAQVDVDATPAALASPTVQNDLLWTLPFESTNVEVGATALSGGALYRLIRSDEFTGVQAVDTSTGTEKWRSAQEWSGNGLAAGSDTVAFTTATGVVALDTATGTAAWTQTLAPTPISLTRTGDRLYAWDGISAMTALQATDGSIVWQGDNVGELYEGRTAATQAPVANENGVAAVSGNRVVVLYDADGNWITNVGNFDPATIEMSLADPTTLIFAGAGKVAWEAPTGPYDRQVVSVDLGSGSVNWQADYNALVNGLVVTDSMAMVLADRLGAPTIQQEIVVDGLTLTVNLPVNPEQSNPYINGYFLDTGEMYQLPEGTPPPGWEGHAWIADPGIPPFVALAQGTNGPIGISASGRLSFFNSENPLVQAVVDLPELIPSSVMSDGPNVYASEEDGALVAVAPVLADLQTNPVTRSGNLDWTVPLDGTLTDFGGMTYGNGLVYRLIETSAGRRIEATYASTGQPAWTLPFDWSTDQIVADPGPSRHEQNPTWTGSGNVFAVDANNRLTALNDTGTSSWQVAFEQPVVSMVFDAGTLFVWDESGTMTALNAADGSVLWATSSGSAGGSQTNEYGMPVPVTTKTLVAMVDAEGNLHGFDRTTGEVLWSNPGFAGTNSRLVVSGEGLDGQDQWIVILSADGEPDADGNFKLTAAGILAQTGEYRWADYLQGPLLQPVTSDETFVTFIASEAMPGKAVTITITPIVDAESPNHYGWTDSGSSTDSTVPGAQRLFAIDAPTGQIVWIRTSPGPEFTGLVADPIFRRGQVVTADGLLVSPSGGSGWIDGAPLDLGGPVLATASSGELGAIGSFATLADGTLVTFGRMPFSQQG